MKPTAKAKTPKVLFEQSEIADSDNVVRVTFDIVTEDCANAGDMEGLFDHVAEWAYDCNDSVQNFKATLIKEV